MRGKFILICLLNFFSAFILRAEGYEFRHQNSNKSKHSYLYITLGLNLPMQNSIRDFNALCSDCGDTLNKLTKGEIANPDSFPSNKIGGMVGVGYKYPYFWRIEGKLDYTTFSKIYKNLLIVADDANIYKELQVAIRQFGFILSTYIDIDNPSLFTPYLGGGIGGVFAQGIVFGKNDTSDIKFTEQDLLDKFFFIYELNAGFRVGSQVASFSIEAFARKTPKIDLTSKGVMLKANFQL